MPALIPFSFRTAQGLTAEDGEELRGLQATQRRIQAATRKENASGRRDAEERQFPWSFAVSLCPLCPLWLKSRDLNHRGHRGHRGDPNGKQQEEMLWGRLVLVPCFVSRECMPPYSRETRAHSIP